MNNRILLFAGTTEGRELARFLEEQGISCLISVATEYGETLIDRDTSIHSVHVGRLDADGMEALMRSGGITDVIDATHPYATEVTQTIKAAAIACGCRCYRVLREQTQTPDNLNVQGNNVQSNNVQGNNVQDNNVQDDNAQSNNVQSNNVQDNIVHDNTVQVNTVEQAVAYLAGTTGAILAATGSKELFRYTVLPNYRERVYARVLSTRDSVETAVSLGFEGSHLICMQGPFTEEMNTATLRQTGARYLVTKESGKTGGFPEKVRAARQAGAVLVVVGRPCAEEGFSLEEMKELLLKEILSFKETEDAEDPAAQETENTADRLLPSREPSDRQPSSRESGNMADAATRETEATVADKLSSSREPGNMADAATRGTENAADRLLPSREPGNMADAATQGTEAAVADKLSSSRESETTADASPMGEEERLISVIGIGMGDPRGMTREAWETCMHSDVLIGAKRMLEAVKELQKKEFCSCRTEEITAYIHDHPQEKRIAVLFSGDIGFYSGAGKLLESLKQEKVRLQICCGISSVMYLCGRLQMTWEDTKLVSLHGRCQNLIAAVSQNQRTFVLTGRQEEFSGICDLLDRYGLSGVTMHAGSRLSYEDEIIRTGTPSQLRSAGVGDLCAVLIENPDAVKRTTQGLPDDVFLRDRVPMTKSEVRAVSLSKLRLRADSVIYDIGAGTGSVSVEMALSAPDGYVYAIEKNPEAARLILMNAEKLRASNLEVTVAQAPEGLENLPVPTHAFIGGSSGNLREILKTLLEKNPRMRIVINAISLETVQEATACLHDLPLTDQEIVCVQVSKAREAGRYHMMTGQNPVYIISCTGNA